MLELEVDGSFFSFPSGWVVEKIDEWPEQNEVTQPPFNAKSCDFIAYHAETKTAWIVEVKDYTYPGVKVPRELPQKVALKIFHTLAVLSLASLWSEEKDHKEFCKKLLEASSVRVCLAVELPDGGRKLMGVQTPLAHLQEKLNDTLRPLLKGPLNTPKPVVSNHHLSNGVPWVVRRNPATRTSHKDR